MVKMFYLLSCFLSIFIAIACTNQFKHKEPVAKPVVSPEPKVPASGNNANSIINPDNFDEELLAKLLLEGINQLRASKKAGPLSPDPLLAKAALDQNKFITQRGKLSHEQGAKSPKQTVSDRVAYYGGHYDMVGENLQLWGFMVITQGRKSTTEYTTYKEAAEGLVKNWVSSKPHYENLVRKEFKLVGTAIGFNQNDNGLYATQVYANYPVKTK